MAGISLLVMIIMRIYCHRKYEECVFSPRKYYDRALTKEMSGFAGWNFITSSSSMIGQYGLGVVLNHFFGTVLNAAQGIANQLCGQLQVFSTTMLKALNPMITKSEGQGNRSLMLQASMTGCKFSFLGVAFFAIPCLIDTDYIMKVWLKTVPEWGVVFFRFQIIRTLTEQLTIALSVSIDAVGDIANMSKVKTVISIAPLLLSYFVFYMGASPYWMYVFWIFCWSILGGIVKIYYANKKCNLSLKNFTRNALIPCLIIFCSVFSITIIPRILLPEGILRFLCIGIMSSVSFILLSWRFSLTGVEKQFISGIISLIKRKIHHYKMTEL